MAESSLPFVLCPHCGKKYGAAVSSAGNVKRCIDCGNEFLIEEVLKTCPMCGEKILAVAKKCKHCGEYLDDASKNSSEKFKKRVLSSRVIVASSLDEKPKINRSIYVILGLFLGNIGIHNFYAGQFAQGYIKIVLTFSMFFLRFFEVPIWWILGFVNTCWVLIDICRDPND